MCIAPAATALLGGPVWLAGTEPRGDACTATMSRTQRLSRVRVLLELLVAGTARDEQAWWTLNMGLVGDSSQADEALTVYLV